MQRALLVISVLALVLLSIAIGTAGANWPFWRRAWQWQNAPQGWPLHIAGPSRQLRPAADPVALTFAQDKVLADLTAGSSTQVLLVAQPSGLVRSVFASGFDPGTRIDGRGLTIGMLAPLFGALMNHSNAGLLDKPVAPLITEWAQDRRGKITARQLLWDLSGLGGATFRPFDPFSVRAQLASGPAYDRAALATRLRFPPGSHYQPEAANAQMLALIAARLTRMDFASTLQSRLWGEFAAHAARGALDHRRGDLAAHCCYEAAAEDWLRLALLLANKGASGNHQIMEPGFVEEIATASPVNPGQGLGYTLVTGVGNARLLVRQSAGRLLVAVPGTGRALLWTGESGPSAALRDALLQAVMKADTPRAE
jgi:hypothetical protein